MFKQRALAQLLIAASGGSARLQHEVFYYPVEGAPLVASRLPVPSVAFTASQPGRGRSFTGRPARTTPELAGDQLPKVFSCFRHQVRVELHLYAPGWYAPNCYICAAAARQLTRNRAKERLSLHCSTMQSVFTEEDHWIGRHGLPQVPLRHLGRHAPAALLFVSGLSSPTPFNGPGKQLMGKQLCRRCNTFHIIGMNGCRCQLELGSLQISQGKNSFVTYQTCSIAASRHSCQKPFPTPKRFHESEATAEIRANHMHTCSGWCAAR